MSRSEALACRVLFQPNANVIRVADVKNPSLLPSEGCTRRTCSCPGNRSWHVSEAFTCWFCVDAATSRSAREMSKKLGDLLFGHFARMPFATVDDEAL